MTFFLAASAAFLTTAHASGDEKATAVSVSLTLPPQTAGGAPDAGARTDDIIQLKRLAAGVGWEFTPNEETTEALRGLGMKTIRCINVDNIPGDFNADGRFEMQGPPVRLDAHLATCETLQARPHIIIGASVPKALRLTVEDARERFAILGQTPGKRPYWNGDWEKMNAYWKAIFHHVLVVKGFKNARFEVGNEPDIDGQFPRLVGSDGTMGSAALFASYFQVYEQMVRAAEAFEAENPGERVVLGGPAVAWAYTFKFGAFNWIERFLADGAAGKLRLDFIGVHFYGNIASLRGEYEATYPSFTTMMETTRLARDRNYPGVPIIVTEWGPSYHTNSQPAALINADHRGAAWSAAFLKTMLEQKVDEALFLVTTDLQRTDPKTKAVENGWGWPAFFVNPQVFGRAWPKAPVHVFDMISRLSGEKVSLAAERRDASGKTGVDGFAAFDRSSGRTTVLLWNYAARLPENGPPVELGDDARVTLRFDPAILTGGGTSGFGVKTWMVSETLSNAHALFVAGERIDERSRLQLTEDTVLPAGSSTHTLTLPRCSVAFLTIEPR